MRDEINECADIREESSPWVNKGVNLEGEKETEDRG